MSSSIQPKPRRISKKKEVETPVQEQEPEVVENVVEVETVTEEDSLEKQCNDLKEMLSNLNKEVTEKLKTFKDVEALLKKLTSAVKKEMKKKKRKSRSNAGVPSEHGFNAPVVISDELAHFLSVPKGTKMRRPEVTSLISKYANENGLKDENNRSIFKPDSKLKKLLGPAVHPLKKNMDIKGYGIFNLQIYLKRHFIKATPETLSVVA